MFECVSRSRTLSVYVWMLYDNAGCSVPLKQPLYYILSERHYAHYPFLRSLALSVSPFIVQLETLRSYTFKMLGESYQSPFGRILKLSLPFQMDFGYYLYTAHDKHVYFHFPKFSSQLHSFQLVWHFFPSFSVLYGTCVCVYICWLSLSAHCLNFLRK